jgi:peroxiredoxin
MVHRLLWLAVACLFVSACHERAEAEPSAELGRPAPAFTLVDTAGKTHKLSDYKGKIVVLEWFNPDCPFVKAAHGKGPLKELAKQSVSAQVVWLSINSGAPGKQGSGVERNRAGIAEFGIANPVLLDEKGEVGKAYGAAKTPHLFIVDPKGKLAYRGGLDNAPMGVVDNARPRLPGSAEGELSNYVTAALEDLKQQRPLRLPDTPPYGCGVKYAD